MRAPLLLRQAVAEFLGSAGLVAVVIGSGIAAQRLSPDDVGLQLLENALITGAVLVALILTLGPVSAAFNPLVTLAERLFGAITTREAGVFIGAQLVGGPAVARPRVGAIGSRVLNLARMIAAAAAG